jgi:hypothetical protein
MPPLSLIGKQKVDGWQIWKALTRYNSRRIFLSNCWWQKSDIWSQASYRYTILWIAFLDPSDSYFLFADLVGFYTHWTYSKQKVDGWQIWKALTRYNSSCWSSKPNIKSFCPVEAVKSLTKLFWTDGRMYRRTSVKFKATRFITISP